MQRLGLTPREIALDSGFMPGLTNSALKKLAPFRPPKARLQLHQAPDAALPYRFGRPSGPEARYGPNRNRVMGAEGQRIWTE
jgi:hypothetical protein